MHYSRLIKSSTHCRASPDGQLIATLEGSSIRIRSVKTLRSLNVSKLPLELSSPIIHLIWGPSSTRILAASADHIAVLSVTDSACHASIANPLAGQGKPSYIQFGANDSELILFAPFGLKVLLFNLLTSKAVEIPSPKFHLPGSVKRGFSIRTGSGHLALLTRSAGKDVVSIHHPDTRQLERSWYPATLDAQAVVWSPDGSWLLLWDSPAQGRRILLYTPDGQLFRNLGGADKVDDEAARLNVGIKLCHFSPDSRLCAFCDHTRKVTVLNTSVWREELTLVHPVTIVPSDTLQVWQEQRQNSAGSSSFDSCFVRASQDVAPPAASEDVKSATELKVGCSVASFDSSGTLLATRLDEHPGTVWVWDLLAGELRAVLMFHSPADVAWHPSVRELLLVTCSVEQVNLHFHWDPLSNGPGFVKFQEQLADGKVVGKLLATWIDSKDDDPKLLLTDRQNLCLLSLSETDNEAANGEEDTETFFRGDSSARQPLSSIRGRVESIRDSITLEDEGSMLEDTFSFKHS
ncbi:unnamed protein product [Clonostachys rhizophaga]|uniref:WD repeat-containing protein WRAP73 n=1 Tax=Clonostachys rhizophaga TaxID=160324 RepID=A0A9N9VPI9_9HYPO|nr:unnamed protein product [Clonostachys rhizophaga]